MASSGARMDVEEEAMQREPGRLGPSDRCVVLLRSWWGGGQRDPWADGGEKSGWRKCSPTAALLAEFSEIRAGVEG